MTVFVSINTYMENTLSGHQLIASIEVQKGNGLSAPNISANLSMYESFEPVKNYKSIYTLLQGNIANISSNSSMLLVDIGANSFPQLFGQTPYEFSTEIGIGPLIDKTYANTSNLFANGVSSYLQTLSIAQNYASASQSVLSSATTTQWVNGPQASTTGGFSNIGGSTPSSFSNIANCISEMGTLMIPELPYSGFSNAGCLKQIVSVSSTVGNLNHSLFGQTIYDSSTNANLVINEKLLDYIIANPAGRTANDTFQIVALNPLDIELGKLANVALSDIVDLDEVVTFLGVDSNIASSINYWTDCCNLHVLFGNEFTTVQSNMGIDLDVYSFIYSLVNNISGLTNISSMAALGETMSQITPITNSPELLSQTQPLSSSDCANLRASFGSGSGEYGNPTVDDVLGAANYNDALANVIVVLSSLTSNSVYANISSDTANVASALSGTLPVTLSNGSQYATLDTMAIAASTLINTNANVLASGLSSTMVSLLSEYNGIAETHNNSASVKNSTQYATVKAAQTAASSASGSNISSAISTLKGLQGLIQSVIFQTVTPSKSMTLDSNNPAISLKTPSGSALGGITGALTSTAVSSDSDAVSGSGHLTNCIDKSSLGGQAIAASMTEAKNNKVLSESGLSSTSFSAATSNLNMPSATGTKTLGGGLIKA